MMSVGTWITVITIGLQVLIWVFTPDELEDWREGCAFGPKLTALTALSYCSPLIETLGKRFGERLVGKAITAAATRLLLARAALVFASLEVSIFLLFVSGVIWVFTDDALEKWCDRCAFGAKRKALPDAYNNAATQKKQFDEALLEVL